MTNTPQDPAAPELSAEELDLAVGGASVGGPNRSSEMEQKAKTGREAKKKSSVKIGEETNKVTLPGDGSV